MNDTTTIHHPSCPKSYLVTEQECVAAGRHLALMTGHDVDHCAVRATCLCGPEAAAEDALILAERTPDEMLLDIVTHVDGGMAAWVANAHTRRAPKGLLACILLDNDEHGTTDVAGSWGVAR